MFDKKKILSIYLPILGVVIAAVIALIFLLPDSNLPIISSRDTTAYIGEEFTLEYEISDEFASVKFIVKDENIVKNIDSNKFKALKVGKTVIQIIATNYSNKSTTCSCKVEVLEKISNNPPKDNDQPDPDDNPSKNPDDTTSDNPPSNDPNETPINPDDDNNFENQFTISSDDITTTENTIYVHKNIAAYIYINFEDSSVVPEFTTSDDISIQTVYGMRICYKITAATSGKIDVYSNATFLGTIIVEIID